jgi:hypothetical protein
VSIYLHKRAKPQGRRQSIAHVKFTHIGLNPNFLPDSTKQISWNPIYF